MQYDDYVVIIAIEGNKVITQKQYKSGARKNCFGFPAGFKKKTETSLKAAKRELFEETGYQAKKWNKLGTFYDNASISSAKFTIFTAQELTKLNDGINPDISESRIENTWTNPKDLKKITMEGACMALARELHFKNSLNKMDR